MRSLIKGVIMKTVNNVLGRTDMGDENKGIAVTVDGIKVKEVFQLKDGRMEVRWDALDIPIPDEIEYLTRVCEMNLARTEAEAAAKSDPVEYIFTKDAFWEGIRCPKEVWGLFMKCKGFSDEDVMNFYRVWAVRPVKALIDKALYDTTVRKIAAERPWEPKK